MITVYRYPEAWDVPSFSPFVTKVVYYLQLARIPHELVDQDVTRLQQDAPYGKLPYIVDGGRKIADSSAIIAYLEDGYGHRLDGDASAVEKAQMLAWNRMLDEHTYWCAVVQPRWREDANFEVYLPIIYGGQPVPPEARAFIEGYRTIMVSQLLGQGMGRLPAEGVYQRARADVDALADFLGDKPYFMGEKCRSIDATVLSMVKHIVDSPFSFDTKEYLRGKTNLIRYRDRLQEKLG